ncbi:hypothetical protein M6G53_06370 [Serratia nevei]|uniref:hypothetical protein n=1 Tax=Serratia nevei TaxID=2703794 RepID=UPI00209E4584|nr:hypothetical protein [Serratia nevei]MCP1105026.1 hypothetical protein [Serratia nevei]
MPESLPKENAVFYSNPPHANLDCSQNKQFNGLNFNLAAMKFIDDGQANLPLPLPRCTASPAEAVARSDGDHNAALLQL